MKIYLRTFKLAVTAIVLLNVWQCESPSQQRNPSTGFKPEINVTFNSTDSNRAHYAYVVGEPDQEVMGESIIPALKNGKITAFKNEAMDSKISEDSLSHYIEGSNHQILIFGLDWQVLDAHEYCAPRVKFVEFKALDGKKAEKGPTFLINSESLAMILNQEEKEKLNNEFYKMAIKEPFEKERRDVKMDEEMLPDRHTVRPILWEMNNTPVRPYFNERLQNINEKLNKAVQNENLTIYKTSSLNKPVSIPKLEERCEGDTLVLQYRPEPRKRPQHVIDTAVIEFCNPKNVKTYMVLEQWHFQKDEFFGARPELKAVAPVIQPSDQKLVYYWIKWEDVEKSLSEEKTTWLKKYLLFGLKNQI